MVRAVAVLVGLLATGCSFIGVRGSHTWSAERMEPRCTHDSSLPTGDTVTAVISGTLMGAMIGETYKPSGDEANKLAPLTGALAVGGGALTLLLSSSAIYGFTRVSHCRAYARRVSSFLDATAERARLGARGGYCAVARESRDVVARYDPERAEAIGREPAFVECDAKLQHELDACVEHRRAVMASASTAPPTDRVAALQAIGNCGDAGDPFWQLTRRAALDATNGHCDVVDETKQEAASLDVTLYQDVYASDSAIAACLAEPTASERIQRAKMARHEACLAERAQAYERAQRLQDPGSRVQILEAMPSCATD